MGDNEPSVFQGAPLDIEDAAAIQAVTLNYRYNFAEPPSPKIQWNLLDLISHARFPLCRKDLCDKWKYPEITAENFSFVMDANRMSEPGSLSARTVTKLISYCLLIAESTAESLPALTGQTILFADTIVAAISAHADEFGSSLEENCPWRHFFVALRHPVVRWGVNNAMMNRWGTEEYPAAK
jgi:hypothetical protein